MAKPKNNLTKRVLHIDLPVELWRKFMHWQIDQGFSGLTEAVKSLIREKVQ